MLDLCDYATSGTHIMLNGWPGNVLTPYERSPHFTVITGFAGRSHLITMIIRTGKEYEAPHPYHTELLTSDIIYIAQSPTGWVDTRLKLAFWKLQVESPKVRPRDLNPLTLDPSLLNLLVVTLNLWPVGAGDR